MNAYAIPTKYRGYRFRSRLEARWAIFFDHMEIPWRYESQGYTVKGRPYLPDFYLPDCATWVEVKGEEDELDHSLMMTAAQFLPSRRAKKTRGPSLLILGPIPDAPEFGDVGWLGIDVLEQWQGELQWGRETFACSIRRGDWQCECGVHLQGRDPSGPGDICEHLAEFSTRCTPWAALETDFIGQWWGFGNYQQRLCPQVLRNTSCSTPVESGEGDWLVPAVDEIADFDSRVARAYGAARAARFEHGETPRKPRRKKSAA